jgi:hypothetical protein
MASIFGLAVNTFQGRMHHASQRIGVLDTQPGDDEAVIIRSGWSSTPDPIVTITEVIGTQLTAAQTGESYRRLQGTLGTVIDQFGFVWANTRCLEAIPEISGSAIANIWMIETRWRFLVAVQRPQGR